MAGPRCTSAAGSSYGGCDGGGGSARQQAAAQQPDPQPLQRQLEPLTLLARVLLEAQAEILSSRQQGSSTAAPAPALQSLTNLSTASSCSGTAQPPAAGQEQAPAAACACCPAGCGGGKENAAAGSQCCSSFVGTPPQPQLQATGVTSAAAQPGQQFIVSSGTLGVSCDSGSAAPLVVQMRSAAGAPATGASRALQQPRRPQAAPGEQRGRWEQQQQPSSPSVRAVEHQFDPSLLDIVRDVEGLLGPAAGAVVGGGGGSWLERCGQPAAGRVQPAGGGGSSSNSGNARLGHATGAVYEETDLFSIIAALE